MHPIEKLPPKPPVQFTAERKERFLELMRHDPDLGGRVTLCAEAVGISVRTVYDHTARDPVFADRFDEARNGFIEQYAMAALLRRGIQGVDKPIIGGKFRDEVVAHERVYSDSLLLAYLRAYKTEFRDRGDSAGAISTSGSAGVLIVPTAPLNVEEWQAAFGDLAKGDTGRPGGEA